MSLLNLQNVKLKPAEHPPIGELSDKIYYECNFCGKMCGLTSEIREICERIVGQNVFYCPFCIRHNYYTKTKQHVLILSFRSVFGYFYYSLYANKRRIWLAEIKDYINEHVRIGLQNPVFSYDPETYLWFIDFSKVGCGRKKIEVEEVLKTVMNILACFNLYEYAYGHFNQFYEKYREAIIQFHTLRRRPKDYKFLIPTLNFNDLPKNITIEDTKNFIPENMKNRY